MWNVRKCFGYSYLKDIHNSNNDTIVCQDFWNNECIKVQNPLYKDVTMNACIAAETNQGLNEEHCTLSSER